MVLTSGPLEPVHVGVYTPGTMNRPRLHHVALGARDVGRVTAFYRDVLGLPEQKRHHHADGSLRSTWLDLGGATLMVEHTTAPGTHVEGVGAGPFLLAVRVTREERATLERLIESHGGRIEHRTEHTSYARDPEGNRVGISHHPLADAP